MKNIVPSCCLRFAPRTLPHRWVLWGMTLLGGLAVNPARLSAQDSLSSGANYEFLQEGVGSAASYMYGQPDGSPVGFSYTNSFTGLDGSGHTQTMTFSGSASGSAQYGQLHASASGTVTNTYYNSSNAPYVTGYNTFNPAGSPTGFLTNATASFSDTLQYGGALQSGYQARYIFHLDGTISGANAGVGLDVVIAGLGSEEFNTGQTGDLSMDFATSDVPINGQDPQKIFVELSTGFAVDLTYGQTPDGSNISSMAQFADTLTLTAVEVVDANGNPVSGVTISSESGAAYANVVPEPSTWAAMLAGAGLLAFVVRRRAGAL